MSCLGNYKRVVSWGTIVATTLLCIVAILLGDGATSASGSVMKSVYENIDWVLALYSAACVVFLVFISFSRWGSKKLGKPDDEPEYSTLTWAAMLMCCGVAVGVFFWSVVEPLHHYMQTPYIAQSQTSEAVSVAIGIVDFDWGVSIWALYSVIGLAIGVAAYRHGCDFSLSSAFAGFSIVGRHAGLKGILDFICSFFTIIGLSISLGMGTLSISYGISRVFGIDSGLLVNIIVMIIVGVVFTISSIRGIKKGMAVISNAAIIIAAGLCVFILVFGPRSFILRSCFEGLGVYMQYFPTMAFFTDPTGQSDGWPLDWTLFYYAWALTWTPYVGGFFAKVSKGRTLREFCLGTMLLPTIISVIWFGIVGGATLGMYLDGTNELWSAVQTQVESGFFVLLDQMPLTGVLSVIVLIDLVLFMATSCDGAVNYVSLVLTRGKEHPKVGLKLLIAFVMVLCPIALIVGGGLQTIRNVALIAGAPFIVLGVFAMISTVRMLAGNQTAGDD